MENGRNDMKSVRRIGLLPCLRLRRIHGVLEIIIRNLFNPKNTQELEQHMLQERRRKRREIKDEMDKTALMRSTFLDRAIGIKIQQSLEVMEKMKERQYTPRKQSKLFDQQQRASA